MTEEILLGFESERQRGREQGFTEGLAKGRDEGRNAGRAEGVQTERKRLALALMQAG